MAPSSGRKPQPRNGLNKLFVLVWVVLHPSFHTLLPHHVSGLSHAASHLLHGNFVPNIGVCLLYDWREALHTTVVLTGRVHFNVAW